MNGNLSQAPNVGLADLSGVGKVFYYLRHRFYPVEFADLCTLIDEIILREYIILVGKVETTPRAYRAAIQPLIDAGVFRILREPFIPQRVALPPPELQAAAQHAATRGLTAATVKDADLEVTRLLGAEAKFGMPATMLLRNLHNFGLIRRPRFDHAVVDLVHKNRELARDARRLHAEIMRRGPPKRGLTYIDAPPLALSVLKRSASFEQLIERILEMRDELALLRRDTSELFEQLVDPRTSMENYAALMRDWERKWRKSWDTTTSTKIVVCNTSLDLIRKGVGVVEALSDPTLLKAVSTALGLIGDFQEATSLRALRPLHMPVRDYLLTPRDLMASAITRVWEQDPDVVDALMREIAAPNSLWRKAFRVERP